MSKGGKSRPYEVAEVTYDENGSKRTWKLMSFSNPQVFALIKGARPGAMFEVTKTKNDQGYDAWTSATPVEANEAAPAGRAASPTGTTKAVGSTYETKEERAVKQRLIVRQSSLAQAIQFKEVAGATDFSVDDILELAESFASWVYAPPDIFEQENDLDKDIPF